jgi:hypothetical protein
MAKPEVVLFLGNCHSRQISNFFGRLPGFADRYESVYFRTYQLGEALGNRDAILQAREKVHHFVEANRSRIRLFVRQQTHGWFDDGLTARNFDAKTDIVDYPACLLNYIWPLAPHGRQISGSPEQLRRFPFSILDSEVLRLKREGVREDQLLERYREIDVVRTYRVDRLRRLNQIKAAEVDEKSSFSIWPFVEASMPDVQMFRTENHPNGPLFAEILRQIGSFTSIDMDRTAYLDKVEKQQRLTGIGPLEAPVHPRIAEHFGLNWAYNKKFNFWGYVQLTFEEYLLRIYRLDADPDYHAARALAAKGDIGHAIAGMEKVVARCPENMAFRKQLETLRWRALAEDLVFERGRTALDEKRIPEAVGWLTYAAELHPHDEFVIRQLELAKSAMRRFAKEKKSKAGT